VLINKSCLNGYIYSLKTVVCLLVTLAAADVRSTEIAAEQVSVNSVADNYKISKIENPDDPCNRELDTYNYEESWYDKTQVYVNSKFCEPALWFDNFFASDRVFDEGVAGTYIRWRNDFIFDEEENFKYKFRLNASVELPVVTKRLRLTIEGDEDENLRDITPGEDSNNSNSIGLQLDLTKNVRSKFSVSVSLKPRIRLRYRYTYPVADLVTLRLTQEIQREKTINSAKTLVDAERLLSEELFFRSSTQGEISEEYEGIDWLQAFVLFQRFSKKTSMSYESSVSGITEPRTMAVNYRLGVRYRKNFHREWLFYEVAPEVTWPVTLSDDRQNVLNERRSVWRILFRLEIHFGNAYKKRYQDYD